MATEIQAAARQTVQAACQCGKKANVTFSGNGVQPANGWWVSIGSDPVLGKAYLAVACSEACIVAAVTKRQAEMDARAKALAAGIELPKPGDVGRVRK